MKKERYNLYVTLDAVSFTHEFQIYFHLEISQHTEQFQNNWENV